MPPKAKISKEDIVCAAVDIVRKEGEAAVNARSVATYLGCSTQPIFSNFLNMDDLRMAVIAKADAIFSERMNDEVCSGRYPPYKASGMAYIRFAKEDPELFKLLYMRNRLDESVSVGIEINNRMESMVFEQTQLEQDMVKRFHFEMWAFVHGIAVMFATGFLNLDWDLVSDVLTDAYQGLRKQYGLG